MTRSIGTPRLRAVMRLHAREHAGQFGRRATTIRLVAGLAVITVSFARLHSMTAGWRDLDDAALGARLWLLMFSSWLTVACMACLMTLQTALQRTEIATLVPLPIPGAARWRMVLARVASSFGPLSIAGLLVVAFTLVQFGAVWTTTFVLWLPSAICLGVTVTLYVAWLGGNGQPRTRALVFSGALALGAMIFVVRLRLDGTVPPQALIPDAILIPALVIGPGARWLGRWYLSLAQELHAAPRRSRNYLGPVTTWLGQIISRHRSPWAAIAVKELRTQTRDVFLLLRTAIVLGALPLYIVVQGAFAQRGIEPAQRIALFALLLGVWCVMETTPSPFGSEGDRLKLALLCGASPQSMIVGKALAVIAPLLVQTWVIVLVTGAWSESRPLTTVGAGIVATVAVATIGAVTTCLSVRDIDLGIPVEGGAQALLVEHVPNRPMRLAILGVSLLLAAGASVLVVTTPWIVGLPLIVSVGFTLAAVAHCDAVVRLRRLIPAHSI